MFMDPKSFPVTSVLWSSSKVREYIDGCRASPPPFPSVPDPPPPFPPLPLPIMLLLPKQAMPELGQRRGLDTDVVPITNSCTNHPM